MNKDIRDKKNIFIGGVARAGKSTISQRLSENSKYNHFPVDYIAASFDKHFPKNGINSKVVIDDGSINLSLFLSTIIEKIDKTNEKFIIDSAHVMPKDIIKYLDKEKWDIFFIGYPNISPQDKLNNIRKYDSENSWTRHYNDAQILEIIKGLIKTSKEIEEQCREYDIRFIDTSSNFFYIIQQTIEDMLSI